MELKNKVIAITGGGRGIGLAIAEHLSKMGARVAIGARTISDLDRALASINAQGNGPHLALTCDVRSLESVKNFADSVESELGAIHGLVAAAGVYGEIGPFLESDIEKWMDALDINLTGVVRTVHVFARKMAQAGGGRIVLFSGGGQATMPNFAPYVTAKGGIWRFTETVAAELSEHGIFMNSIAPGAVNTKFLDDLLTAGPEKVGRAFYEKSLKQREQGGESPEKAAKLVEYLMSSRSEGLFGRCLSAVWDDYENLTGLPEISRSDLFAYRRVVRKDGGTRP